MAYRWVVLFFGIVAYATSQFARQSYSGVQKFIAQDLHLDKGALGLLGSAFFYSYALFQLPWGIASDKFGSRWTAALGILLTAATMAGFATAHTEQELLFWRAASGIAGAAAYPAMTGSVARWFPERERGFSQSALGGAGGALGEGTAFFLLPVIAVYFASGWRQGTSMIATVIAAIGVLCLIFLRSAPPNQPATTKEPFDWKLLATPQLWAYTLLFSGFVVGIRILQPWIAVYAADAYIARGGVGTNTAVISGGILAVVAYSLLGRGIGCPLAGKLSDVLVTRGISRVTVAIGWLVVAIVLMQVLSREITALWPLGLVACLLGVSVNLFTLISASLSETYGPQKTASIVSFVLMVSQLAGATCLALSGYIGMSLNSQAGNALGEYRGIWLAAMAGVAILTIPGTAIHVALNRGWIGDRAPDHSVVRA